VGHFSYFGSRTTSDAIYTCVVTSNIAMAKAAFNKNKAHFTSKLDLN
jgi:hypothetical protein